MPAEIEAACDEFERQWSSETSPAIEDFLALADPASRGDLLRELLRIEIEQRRQLADPAATSEELASRFPDYQDLILEAFGSSGEAETMPVGQNPSITIDADPLQAAATLDWSDRGTPSRPRAPASQFGSYELLGRLGQGGMGVVYKARHLPTGRDVALKVIRSSSLSGDNATDAALVARFRQEAMAAARVEHDHIVALYDAGEFEDSQYYTMRLIEGDDLATIVRSGPLPGKTAARYLTGVAQGVHAAHEKGILHRDLKPHNILVDKITDRALVTDFGLAKLFSEGDRTHAGEVFGTPSYMAPEQATDARSVTVTSDVYSLGATLYHLITGRPPFQASTAVETLRQVHVQQPASPRTLNASVEKDLETIVMKCLEKDPARRYRSCQQLADELQRYTEGKPIQARPVSLAARAARWSKRNPLLATTSTVAILSLLLGLLLSTLFAVRAQRNAVLAAKNAQSWREETIRANHMAGVAEQRRRDATAALYQSLTSNAHLLTEQRSEIGWSWKALEALQQASQNRPADADLPALRSLFTAAWTAEDLRPLGSVASGIDAAALAFSPDGNSLAVGQRKHSIAVSVQIFDVASFELKETLTVSTLAAGLSRLWQGERRYQDGITCLAFSHDGRWLFAGTRMGSVVAWDLSQPTRPQHQWKPFEQIQQITASPNDYRLFVSATSKQGNQLRSYRWEDGQWGEEKLALEKTRGLALSNKHSIGLASPDGILNRYTDHFQESLPTGEPRIEVHEIALSPSGRTAAGIFDAQIRFADVQSGIAGHSAEIAGLDHDLHALDFSDSGQTVVATSRPPLIYLIDRSTGEMLRPLDVPGRVVPIAEFSQSSPLLAVTALKQVELYEQRRSSILSRTDLSAGAIEDTEISADGEYVYTATRVDLGSRLDYQIDAWSFETGELINKYHFFDTAKAASGSLRLDVDGSQLAMAIPGVGYQVFNVPEPGNALDGPKLDELAKLAHRDHLLSVQPLNAGSTGLAASALAFSSSENLCAAIIAADSLVAWKPNASQISMSWNSESSSIFTGMSAMNCLAFSGATLLIGRRDGWLMTTTAEDVNDARMELIDQSPIESIAVRDSRCAMGTQSGRLKFCRLPDLRLDDEIQAFDTAVSSIAITDNCELAVAGSSAGEIGIWYRGGEESHQQVLRVDLKRPIVAICLDSSGDRMVVQLDGMRSVQCWDLKQLRDDLNSYGLPFTAADAVAPE